MKRLVIAFVVVVLLFGGIMPFVRHAHLRSAFEADLRNICFEYNMTTRAKFLDRIDAMCERSQIESEFEVDLTDGKNGAFTLTVSYVDTIRIFFFIQQQKPVQIVIEGTRVEA